jgi:hypothetical protein
MGYIPDPGALPGGIGLPEFNRLITQGIARNLKYTTIIYKIIEFFKILAQSSYFHP